MKVEPRHPPLTAFSMASLTDMVLLLLIFFLIILFTASRTPNFSNIHLRLASNRESRR